MSYLLAGGRVRLKKGTERAIYDDYPTPPEATRALLDREYFLGNVLEPACGYGHISKVLIKNGFNVTSSDITDKGFGSVRDFFDIVEVNDDCDIITNPPYYMAAEFIKHALELTEPHDGKVAMLLRLSFLETEKRNYLFSEYPLSNVYVFKKRLRYWDGKKFTKQGGQFCHAWFVWDWSNNDVRTRPMLGWL